MMPETLLPIAGNTLSFDYEFFVLFPTDHFQCMYSEEFVDDFFDDSVALLFTVH